MGGIENQGHCEKRRCEEMIHFDSRFRDLLAGIEIIPKRLAFDWQGRGVAVKKADLSDMTMANIFYVSHGPLR